MEYKKADRNEIDSLVKMRIAYLNDDYGGLDTEIIKKIEGSLPAYFDKHLNNDMFAYVADDNGIVATAFLVVSEKPANPSFITGKTGTVLNVFTHKDYRRRGIAKHLLQMLLNDAKKLELDYVELKSTKDGYELYKGLGFIEIISDYKAMKYIIDK